MAAGTPGPFGGNGTTTWACVNREGNFCNETTAIPTLACVQSSQTVNATVTASSELGSVSQSASMSLPGCPGAPSISGSAGDGTVSLSWTRPAGTTAMYLELGNNGFGVTAGAEAAGTSLTFDANNGQTETYSMWACNEFGCTNGNRIQLTPTAPTRPLTVADLSAFCSVKFPGPVGGEGLSVYEEGTFRSGAQDVKIYDCEDSRGEDAFGAFLNEGQVNANEVCSWIAGVSLQLLHTFDTGPFGSCLV